MLDHAADPAPRIRSMNDGATRCAAHIIPLCKSAPLVRLHPTVPPFLRYLSVGGTCIQEIAQPTPEGTETHNPDPEDNGSYPAGYHRLSDF